MSANVRWMSSRECSHAMPFVCPTCDFDRYYARKYPTECPWAALTHEKTDPPINRHGDRLNDDYLSPSCKNGMDDEGCASNACSCVCHAPASSTGSDQ